MIHGAPHVWFGDRDQVPPDDENPDCIWFDEHAGPRPPQCATRHPLVDPLRQTEITRAALAFFDAHLKGDAEALARLDKTGERFDEVTLRREVDGGEAMGKRIEKSFEVESAASVPRQLSCDSPRPRA